MVRLTIERAISIAAERTAPSSAPMVCDTAPRTWKSAFSLRLCCSNRTELRRTSRSLRFIVTSSRYWRTLAWLSNAVDWTL